MTAPKVRRVDFSPDEYIAGVAGVLDAAEQGLFWMVCALIMSEGRAITENVDRLSGLCRMRPSQVRKALDAIVAAGKLERTSDGKLVSKRALSEVDRASNRIETARENAKSPRKAEQNQPEEPAPAKIPAELTTNHQPPTTIKEDNQQQPSLGLGTPATEPERQRAAALLGGGLHPRYEEVRAKVEALLNSPNLFVFGRVNAWLNQGADPDTEIYPILEARRANWRGGKLEYFDQPIADAITSRTAPMPAGNGRAADFDPIAWLEQKRAAEAQAQ